MLLEVDGRAGGMIGGLSFGDGPGVYPLLGAMPVGLNGGGSTGPGLTAVDGPLLTLPNPPPVLGLLGAALPPKPVLLLDRLILPPELVAGLL
jgi:hypothetical protein